MHLVVSSAWAAESLDQRYLAGLRERRLFELAENYCQGRLAAGGLGARQKSDLLIELARTYAEHAVQSPPAARIALWQNAHRVAADFERAEPDHPRLMLVQLQDALTWLAQGELARQEAEVLAGRAARLDRARQHLRSAVRLLEEIDNQIAVALRQAARRASRDPAEPTLVELEALEKNVTYQLARAYRNQGQSYPPETNDRANSLTQALEQLAPLAELAVVDSLVWRSRIDRVVCYRQLNDPARATRALGELIAAKPPPEIALRAQAEKIRLLLLAGDLEGALQAVSIGRSAAGRISADLDYAHLETLIAALRAASEADDKERIAQRQRQAAGQVQLIQREHGPYWMRRAETLLASSVTGGVPGDLEALVRAAESYYRGGQIEQALATYDQAFGQAVAMSRADRALTIGLTAAAIQYDRAEHREAIERYRRLALTLRDQAGSADAHLLSIVTTADLIRTAAKPDRGPLFEQYAQLLDEHLRVWPEGATADEARFRLGLLHEARRDWPAAIAAYQAISAGHEKRPDAVRACNRIYDRWIAGLEADDPQRGELAIAAAEFFEAIILGPERQWPESWTPLQRDCALYAARLRLQHTAKGFVSAERLLVAALQSGGNAKPDWQSEARILLVYALASQNRRTAAAAVMDQISGGSVDALLAMLSSLNRLAETARPAIRSELAELELRAVALLESQNADLAGDELRKFRTLRAAALARGGRIDDARQAYDQLAEQYPKDGTIHEARAKLLAGSDKPADLKKALRRWHEVEKKSRRGTPRWFRARYAQADIYYRTQETAKAAKLIKFTQVLQPDLGGAEMKKRFLALLERCER